ncbi:MAG: TonB-dependent receptor [Neisseriaceae bacterium]
MLKIISQSNNKYYQCVKSFCFLSVLMTSSSSFAAETQSLKVGEAPASLGEIVVIGDRPITKQKPFNHASILDQKIIEASPKGTIAEVLRDLPGVSITDSNNAGTKRIRIRSENSRRVAILVDGQELTDHSNYGAAILVPISEIAQVEVVRGPASVLYGSKALGGVVNIITKNAGSQRPFSGELGSLYLGQANGWLVHGAMNGTVNHWSYRIAMYKQKQSDLRVPRSSFSAYQKHLEHTKTQSEGVDLNVGYRFGEQLNHLFRIKLETSNLSAQNWREPALLTTGVMPLTFFDIDLPKRDKRKLAFFYDGENISKNIGGIHFDAFYQQVIRDFRNTLSLHPFAAEDFFLSHIRGRVPPFLFRSIPQVLGQLQPLLNPIEMRLTNTSRDTLVNYGGSFHIDLHLPRMHNVTVGGNYLVDQVDSDKLTSMSVGPFLPTSISNLTRIPNEFNKLIPNHYKAHINTFSLFDLDQWNFAPHWSLTTGWRYYQLSTHLDKTTKEPYAGHREKQWLRAVGLAYDGLPNTVLQAYYSEGYTSPNLMQLFITTSAGGVTSIANSDLKSEKAKNIELAVNYSTEDLNITANLFSTRTSNYISLRRCIDNAVCGKTTDFMPSAIYENADWAKSYGLELSVSYALTEALKGYLDMTWMKRKESLHNRLTEATDTPRVAGRVGIRYSRKDSPFWIDGYLRGASRSTLAPELNPNNPGGTHALSPLPGWVTANLSAGFNTKLRGNKQLEVVVELNNLTNTRYRSSFNSLPGAARNIAIATRWRF